MKKTYVAPQLEVEEYELNASIASNCAVTVNSGPAMIGYRDTACPDYLEHTQGSGSTTFGVREYNINFYDENVCTCYTTGEGGQYFTS